MRSATAAHVLEGSRLDLCLIIQIKELKMATAKFDLAVRPHALQNVLAMAHCRGIIYEGLH